MSFTIDMTKVLQYAYNTTASFMPMVYLWLGSALAIWIIWTVVDRIKGGSKT